MKIFLVNMVSPWKLEVKISKREFLDFEYMSVREVAAGVFYVKCNTAIVAAKLVKKFISNKSKTV